MFLSVKVGVVLSEEEMVMEPTPKIRCHRVRVTLISRIRYSSTSSSLTLKKPMDRNRRSSLMA